MKTIKAIWLAVTRSVKLISEIITKTRAQRQRQAGLKEFEAERLDRIRNPSKYRGK